VKDAEKTFQYFEAVENGDWFKLQHGITFRFRRVGHIIGACFIEMDIEGKRFVFSGDIGRPKDLLMHPPQRPEMADVLFIESTYGDRLHPKEDETEKLSDIVNETFAKGGTLVIPSFTVERAQLIMYLLWQLALKNKVPHVPMILDSPMGSSVLDIFIQYVDWQKLPPEECERMFGYFKIVKDYTETLDWIADPIPKIVIAGSGMLTGGRVLNYLMEYISKPETTVLLTGFQSEGSRGRELLDGTHELKIYGKYYPVKARIESMSTLSSHADQQDLIDWMSELKNTPEHIFIIHGESTESDAFRVKIEDTYGWKAHVPELFERKEIY
jgi:metallo-beta-lactamase family protein